MIAAFTLRSRRERRAEGRVSGSVAPRAEARVIFPGLMPQEIANEDGYGRVAGGGIAGGEK